VRKIQKIIIILYCSLVAFSCIYVPWGYKVPYKTYEFVGYAFIWKPPVLPGHSSVYANTVEFLKMLFELIALTALFGGLFALT